MITCVLNAAEGQLDIVLGVNDSIVCSQRWYVPIKGMVSEDAGTGTTALYAAMPSSSSSTSSHPHSPSSSHSPPVVAAAHLLSPVIGGTEILTHALEAMCALMRIKPTDIRRFACVNGPGSFTGIRLVLSTVAAIRRVTGAQVAPLDFMQSLAVTAQARDHALSGTRGLAYWVLTHARRDVVHCEIFQQEEGIPTSREAVFLCSPLQVAERIVASTAPAVVLGSGFARNKDVLAPALYSHLYPHGLIVPLACTSPDDTALWSMAQQATYTDNDVEPLYVRACDAVENLPHIAKTLGLDPEMAQIRLQKLLSK